VPPGPPDAVMTQTGTERKKKKREEKEGTIKFSKQRQIKSTNIEIKEIQLWLTYYNGDFVVFVGCTRCSGTHCTGGWVGPRAGRDTEDRGKILCPCRESNLDRPVVQPVVRH
jgi:hypothetical protein